MQHLEPDTLARLVDEPGLPPEAEHLERCGACRQTLDELRVQTQALGGLPKEITPPREAWARLDARLREEGLLRPRKRRLWTVRAAAGVALFLAGTLAGTAAQRPTDPGTLAGGAANVEETLRSAEAAYLEALTRYAELTGIEVDFDPYSRLAALEGIVMTTRTALESAPADPVINTYHLAAVGQREAMLRQLAAAHDDPWF
jgi:hypothetical protein